MPYYHPDHLGSTSYVTDASGEVYQHLEYTAFGETFVEEHSNTNRTPYLFNGKELDKETGLYYYGARYYDPKTSVFQSVDRFAEKYPGLTPYHYGANNPIKFVDVNGDSTGKPSILQQVPNYSWSSSLFSPTNWYGSATIKNDIVRSKYDIRSKYDNGAKALNSGDKQGRVDLKERTRAATPEPFKTIVEQGRPMSGERAKLNDPTINNVNKTNVEVNEAVKTTSTIGKVFVIGGVVHSTVNIATSTEPGKQTVVEAGAWAGAIKGGSIGAELGSAFGPYGSFIGGVAGSITGSILGSGLGRVLADNIEVSGKRYNPKDTNTWPIMNR